MSADEVRCLKRYFEIKSLHVSDYWLQCCLEWFKGEYNTYTEDLMCNSVYQQWLDSDLRDIEVRSLPNNLVQQKKTTLNGKYAVQVMYIKNISNSAYSQLKNIRDMYKLTRSYVDKDNENENESHETTGKRVLYLYMTDGVQNIQGFEYHAVSCLNLYMPPGIKILLTGPLIVRNGEFMFKENNVKVLGGEVEDLKIVNAAENVLARELNMPENPNPKTSELKNIQNQTNNSNNAVSVNNNHRNVNGIMQFEDEQFLANFDTSAFEEQEAAIQTLNQDADLDVDDDLFEALDISEQQIANKQNLTNSVCDAELAENLEQIERQEFERRLEEEEKDFNFHLEDDVDIVNKIIEEKSKQEIIAPIITTSKPFVYIKYLQDNLKSVSSDNIYLVKAWFSNIVEKVKLSKSKGWTMKFEIRDASGKIIVDFSSDVIEELMGLSPSEALAENRSVKHKVTKSHEKLTQALAKCKEKMESVEYVMDLKFNEDKSSVTIIRLEPVNKQLLEELKNRVENISIQIL